MIDRVTSSVPLSPIRGIIVRATKLPRTKVKVHRWPVIIP